MLLPIDEHRIRVVCGERHQRGDQANEYRREGYEHRKAHWIRVHRTTRPIQAHLCLSLLVVNGAMGSPRHSGI
jgi:hypothetical protein